MSGALVFARPTVLWCLVLLVPWAFLRWRRERRSVVPWSPLQLGGGGRSAGRGLLVGDAAALALEVVLIAVLIVGVAGPQTRRELELVTDEGIDVLLVLDVSLSMLATDLPPDRLTVLRETADAFVAQTGEARMGILIFAGDVYVQTPLTSSRRSVARLLESVTVSTLNQASSGGTAIGDALLMAGDVLRKHRLPDRSQAVVLITDGESNVGSEPELGARWLQEEGVHLHIVGVGGREPVEVFYQGERVGGEDSPYLAVLDDASLEAIAEAGGGRWYRATDAGSLSEIFAELNRLESAPLENEIVDLRSPATLSWAGSALLLFSLHVLVGNAGRRRPLR